MLVFWSSLLPLPYGSFAIFGWVLVAVSQFYILPSRVPRGSIRTLRVVPYLLPHYRCGINLRSRSILRVPYRFTAY